MTDKQSFQDILKRNSLSCQITEKPQMDKIEAFKKAERQAKRKNDRKKIEIYSPVTGSILPLESLADGAFSSGLLGRGVAIRPVIGRINAPVDGKIDMIFESGHAIGMTADGGAALLFHVGLTLAPSDAEKDLFTIFVHEGERVLRGDCLLEFDLAQYKKAGLEAVLPVLITNEEEYDAIYLHKEGAIRERELLMTLV